MQEMVREAVAEVMCPRHVRLDLPLGYSAAAAVLNGDVSKINILKDIVRASGNIWFNIKMTSLEVVAITILIDRHGLSPPGPEEYGGPLYSQHELRSGLGFMQVFQVDHPTCDNPGGVSLFFREHPGP